MAETAGRGNVERRFELRPDAPTRHLESRAGALHLGVLSTPLEMRLSLPSRPACIAAA